MAAANVAHQSLVTAKLNATRAGPKLPKPPYLTHLFLATMPRFIRFIKLMFKLEKLASEIFDLLSV